MTVERQEHSGVPRTSFTFFPNPLEQEMLRQADATTLAIYASTQPDMAAQFFHELWRNNRTEVIYSTVSKVDLKVVGQLITEAPIITAIMHAIYQEPLLTCESFLKEIFTIVVKNVCKVPINETLNAVTQGYIASSVDGAMQIAQTYKAKMN